MKNFILDTNVALIDSNCLYKFGENNIHIPLSVIRELETFKTNLDILGKNARAFCKIIDELTRENNTTQNIKVKDSTLFISELDSSVADNDIVTIALNLPNSIVVSNDTQVRIFARGKGVLAQEYKAVDEKDLDDLYDGIKYINIEDILIDEAYQRGSMALSILDIDYETYPNQQFVISGIHNENKKFIGILKDKTIFKCNFLDNKPSGIKTRNLEQRLAVNLLLDEDISCVTLSGTHGSSKSFLALACALQIYDEHKCDKILIIRSPIALSKDLNSGFVKGNQVEKLMANMGAISSNLENMKEGKSRLTGNDLLESYIEQKIIEPIDVSRILGSSFTNKIIIVDEAQSFTANELRAIISRVGENSRMFITSDLKQQSMNKLLPEATGVFRLIENMKQSELTGHITMKSIYRSEFVQDIEKYW